MSSFGFKIVRQLSRHNFTSKFLQKRTSPRNIAFLRRFSTSENKPECKPIECDQKVERRDDHLEARSLRMVRDPAGSYALCPPPLEIQKVKCMDNVIAGPQPPRRPRKPKIKASPCKDPKPSFTVGPCEKFRPDECPKLGYAQCPPPRMPPKCPKRIRSRHACDPIRAPTPAFSECFPMHLLRKWTNKECECLTEKPVCK